MENKTADLVGAAIDDRLKPFGTKVKKLTFDNDKEFCGHGKIDEVLGGTSYFARPFALCQLGARKQRELQLVTTLIFTQKSCRWNQ